MIDLPDRNEYRFRWYEDNRYQLLDPYTSLPNDPWYVRIRHNMDPQPNEWARMRFSPYRPYMVATWVPGKLVAPGVIEFERKRILFDGKKYPDVLVFNKDYELKWALDGNPVEATLFSPQMKLDNVRFITSAYSAVLSSKSRRGDVEP